ncbi:hypothetical protein EV368DRAFT_20692, partial [Lentinula lateritia]
VLDLLAQNEAIMVMWLQTYLDLLPDQGTWAYVADTIIAHHTPKSYDNIAEVSKINIFLLSWNTDMHKLPNDLQEMIKVAKRHNV